MRIQFRFFLTEGIESFLLGVAVGRAFFFAGLSGIQFGFFFAQGIKSLSLGFIVGRLSKDDADAQRRNGKSFWQVIGTR